MEVFKLTKKEEKKEKKSKKVVKSKVKKENYFKSVFKELKLVKWPALNETLKYTIATIVFCVVISGFFVLLNMLMSWIKGMFI